MTIFRLMVLAGFLCLECPAHAGALPTNIPGPQPRPDSLARFVLDGRPWLHMPANSEQRQPVYLGATSREMALKLEPRDGGNLRLVDSLRHRLEGQTRVLRRALMDVRKVRSPDVMEFEAWPVRDDFGEMNWAYARWRTKGESQWHWLDASMWPGGSPTRRAPFLPILLDPKNKDHFAMIFNDVLNLKELYDKPLFGDCIWTDPERQEAVVEAWLPVKNMDACRKNLARRLEPTTTFPPRGSCCGPRKYCGTENSNVISGLCI